MEQVNIERCLKGMQNIYLSGNPHSPNRQKLIEEAIQMILENGEDAFKKIYIGFKNYASFGDQRSDCEYGMGPRHGGIVFDIGRTGQGQKAGIILGADEIYYLECERDFKGDKLKSDRGDYEVYWTLAMFIRKIESLKHDLTFNESYLIGAKVEEVCKPVGA